LRGIINQLAVYELYALVIAVFASFIFEQALAVGLALAGAFAIARFIDSQGVFPRSSLDPAICILTITALGTLIFSADRVITVPQVMRLLLGIALFYAMVGRVKTRAHLGWIVAGTMLSAIGLALYAPINVEWITTKLPVIPAGIYELFETLTRDTTHRNVMAGTLVILLPIPMGLLTFSIKEFSAWQRLFITGTAVLLTVTLVLTQSRGALLATVVFLFVLLAFRFRKGLVFIPVAVIVALVLVDSLGFEPIVDQISTGISVGGFEGRMEIWSRAIYMIQDFPFTGIGMGRFGEVADRFYPFFLAPSNSIDHAHNLLLQVAVDLGIPGLIAWLAIWIGVTHTAWLIYREGRSTGSRWALGLGAGLVGSQIALLTHGMVDAVTWGMVKPSPFVWALWGLTIAGWNVLLMDRSGLAVHSRQGLTPTPSDPREKEKVIEPAF
jgi:putative inorganic carbon (HCO3(-)) transporter